MNIAILSAVDVVSKVFTYNLSRPYYIITHETPIFEVFSRQDFTKVCCNRHREVCKSLGVWSHARILRGLDYTRETSLQWIENLSDEELLTCIEEFTKTGDDLEPFLEELEKR